MLLAIHILFMLLIGTFVALCYIAATEQCKNKNYNMMHKYDNIGVITTLLYILFIMPLEYPSIILFAGYLLYEACEIMEIDNIQ